jgi:hypothetical protein
MDATNFLLLGAIVLVATVAVGLLGWPKPPAARPKPPQPASRWTVFRIHPQRLLEGGEPAVEGIPDGLKLTANVPFRAERPRIDLLAGKGQPRIFIRKLWRPGRPAFRIAIDRRRLAELRPAKDGKGMPAILSTHGLSLHGSFREREIELRRGGKLLASASPGIIPSPGSLGVEVLAAEDPFPILAVVTAVALLAELWHPSPPAGRSLPGDAQKPAPAVWQPQAANP